MHILAFHAGSQELMGHNGIASIDDLGVVAALVEHAHVKSQHVGKIHGAACAALIRADDHHMAAVNLKVCLVLQQILKELVNGPSLSITIIIVDLSPL